MIWATRPLAKLEAVRSWKQCEDGSVAKTDEVKQQSGVAQNLKLLTNLIFDVAASPV
jgi:hypothetical protein